MRCEELQTWMLTDETPHRASGDVRSHLRGCAACRLVFGRLVRLLHVVEIAPLDPLPVATREQFLARLEPRPAVSASPPEDSALSLEDEGPATLLLPPRRSAWTRWTSWAAAALVLLGLGLGIGKVLQPGGGEPSDPIVEKDADSLFAELEERFLTHHLALAETNEPEQSLQTLSVMAAEVRQESLLLARQHDGDDLALLVFLHGRILHEGVYRAARSLGNHPPAMLLDQVLTALDEGEESAHTLARRSPERIALSLRQLGRQAREVSDALRDGDEPPAPTAQAQSRSRPFLETLVTTTVHLAVEKNPVLRVEHSTRAANAVTLHLSDPDRRPGAEQARRLSLHLSNLCSRAMQGKLERVDPSKIDAKSRQQLEQIRKKVDEARQRAQPVIKKLSSALQHNLNRAFDNSRQSKQFISKDRWPSRKKDRPQGDSPRR